MIIFKITLNVICSDHADMRHFSMVFLENNGPP